MEIKHEEDRPAFTELELDKIFEAPLQANFHNSEHNTRNKSKFLKKINLGYQGKNNPLGLFEAVQKLPKYRYSAQCTSDRALLLGVRIDEFYSKLKSNAQVWEELKDLVQSSSEQIAVAMRSKDKVKKALDKRMSNVSVLD